MRQVARREQGGHAKPNQERAAAALQIAAEPMTQLRSKAALNTAADHVSAPQEQSHVARQLEQNVCVGHFRSPAWDDPRVAGGRAG